jgi:hypothetical protein
MSPTTYYRAALLLPIIFPALVYLFFGESWLFGILVFSLVFGGPAYIIFAILMFIWVGKISSVNEIQNLTLKAPIIFIPLQAVTWMLYFYYGKLSDPELTGGWEALLPFAFYILVLGYVYVLIVNVCYALFKKFGFIKGEIHPNKSIQPTAESGG